MRRGAKPRWVRAAVAGMLAASCCIHTAPEAAAPKAAPSAQTGPPAVRTEPVPTPRMPAQASAANGEPDDCGQACAMLARCDVRATTECPARCAASHFDEQGHCLATRIQLIDEEGCGAMLSAYRGFAPSDDCEAARRATRPRPPPNISDKLERR